MNNVSSTDHLELTREKEFIHCIESGLNQIEKEGEEPFHPFVTTFTDTFQTVTTVLAAEQISQSIVMAAGAIQERTDTAIKYGLVWDGYVTIDGSKSDCIFIEYAINVSATPSEVFCQRYTHDEKQAATAVGDAVYYGAWSNRFFVNSGIGLINKVDWDVLVRSPFCVLALVAAESGVVGEIEHNKIIAFLESVKNIESQSLTLAIEHGVKDHVDIVASLSTRSDLLSEIRKTRETIGWYAQDKGAEFCKGLFELGEHYAETLGKDKTDVLSKLHKALNSH